MIYIFVKTYKWSLINNLNSKSTMQTASLMVLSPYIIACILLFTFISLNIAKTATWINFKNLGQLLK